MKTRLLTLASACALVSCIGTKEFTIRTQPEGAQISINGVPQEGTTPMTLEIAQSKDLGIVASKPGYENAACTVVTQTSWWQSLLWTKSDPRSQYIEEDEVTIPMEKIPTPELFRPTKLPAYTGGGGATTPPPTVPKLGEIPAEIIR